MKKQSYWEDVYAITQLIPRGRVTTYGAIAYFLKLGSPRMVGWALNHCVHGGHIPAQRVVNRKGELSGRHHFSPPGLMQELLEAEGVEIENDAVKYFEAHFWDPAVHLDNDIDLSDNTHGTE